MQAAATRHEILTSLNIKINLVISFVVGKLLHVSIYEKWIFTADTALSGKPTTIIFSRSKRIANKLQNHASRVVSMVETRGINVFGKRVRKCHPVKKEVTLCTVFCIIISKLAVRTVESKAYKVSHQNAADLIVNFKPQHAVVKTLIVLNIFGDITNRYLEYEQNYYYSTKETILY